MKGFIEVNFVDNDRRYEPQKVKFLVNIEHIFYIKEHSFTYKGETEIRAIIVMKGKPTDDYYTEVEVVETYEEIKQKIKEAQEE